LENYRKKRKKKDLIIPQTVACILLLDVKQNNISEPEVDKRVFFLFANLGKLGLGFKTFCEV
jgi:hypothetical protein